MADARIPMIVQRDGYWDGQYPRAGDTIAVDPGHVATLELAGFAVRQAPEPRRETKGSKHGAGR
jgi:hypothetical protein